MTVGGIQAMDAAHGLYGRIHMGRIALAQRLSWLEDGHENDTEYNYSQMQKLLSMTINRYFSGAKQAMHDLEKYTSIPQEKLKGITYAEVIREIDKRYQLDGIDRKMAIEALWVLVAPFIREGRRRSKV